MKRALLLTLVLAGVMVGGLFAFSSWKTGSEYSLLRIKEALRSGREPTATGCLVVLGLYLTASLS